MKTYSKKVGSIYIGVLVFVLIFTLFPLQKGTLTKATSGRTDIPMLIEAKQIANDTVQITFDKPCDVKKAIKSNNYWLQDTTKSTLEGIATLVKEEQINTENALTPDQVSISPVDNSAKLYNLKFNNQIPVGQTYRLIAGNIAAPDTAAYTGSNGSVDFVTK
ncbi:MAG: hypothetical protein Q4G58_03460 [bacterium]|nr:hypothetical protein [bacterium]